jgi:integrase
MATKRANEMGSVYKNVPRKRWQADLVVGHKPHPTRVDDTGRPVMVPIRKSFTGKTQKAVVARLDEAKGALEDGLEVPDNRATLADFTRWWMREVLPGEGLAPRTETWYGEMLESYVLPIVGAKTLTGAKALTPGDVEAMTAELGRRGLSPRVQIAARTTLGKVLRAAEVRGLVGRNVARLARPPKDRGRARAIKALTVDQLSTVLDAVADTRWRPMVLVAATTGLRPGELLALHWADLRLDGHEPHLSVRHALTHVGGASLKAPKRQRSHRTVPLAPAAVAALRAWKRAQATERLAAGPLWNAEWPDLIFTNEARPRG